MLTVSDDEFHRLCDSGAELVCRRADVLALVWIVGGVDGDVVDGMGDSVGQSRVGVAVPPADLCRCGRMSVAVESCWFAVFHGEHRRCGNRSRWTTGWKSEIYLFIYLVPSSAPSLQDGLKKRFWTSSRFKTVYKAGINNTERNGNKNRLDSISIKIIIIYDAWCILILIIKTTKQWETFPDEIWSSVFYR